MHGARRVGGTANRDEAVATDRPVAWWVYNGAFLQHPITPMLRCVMSLPCFSPLDDRRVPVGRLKGHTRGRLGVENLSIFCGFGAKVTETKSVDLCKVFQDIFTMVDCGRRSFRAVHSRLTRSLHPDRFDIKS